MPFTTAITVLGPKLIDLRVQQQFGKDIRWLITHQHEGVNPVEIAAMLKDYHQKALQAHRTVIKQTRIQAKEPNTRKSRRSSVAAI